MSATLRPATGLLRLYTNQPLARNIELYRRHGYAIDREEAWAGRVIVPMRKRLRA